MSHQHVTVRGRNSSLRTAFLLRQESGQTTVEYALLLVLFVGVMLMIHSRMLEVVVRAFAEIVKHLARPGV